MQELVTHIKSWQVKKGDLHIYGEPIEVKRASQSKIPHGVVLVILTKRARRAGKRQTLFYLQKRAANLAVYPGKITASVGGKIRHGETVLQAAHREAKEELKLKLQNPKLLSHQPLSLNPRLPYFWFFPVIAKARGVPKPARRKVNPQGSKWYTASELIEEITKETVSPTTKNLFETLASVKPRVL